MPYVSTSLLTKSIGVKRMHIESFEEVEVMQHRNREVFTQTQIVVHVRPHKSISMRCPHCMKKCVGYDTKGKCEKSVNSRGYDLDIVKNL